MSGKKKKVTQPCVCGEPLVKQSAMMVLKVFCSECDERIKQDRHKMNVEFWHCWHKDIDKHPKQFGVDRGYDVCCACYQRKEKGLPPVKKKETESDSESFNGFID